MKKLLSLTFPALLAVAVHAEESPESVDARLRAIETADRQFLANIDRQEAVPTPPVETAAPVATTPTPPPAVPKFAAAKVTTPAPEPRPQKRRVTAPPIPKAVAVIRAPGDNRSKKVRSASALNVAPRPDRLVKITTTTVTTRVVRAGHDEDDD